MKNGIIGIPKAAQRAGRRRARTTAVRDTSYIVTTPSQVESDLGVAPDLTICRGKTQRLPMDTAGGKRTEDASNQKIQENKNSANVANAVAG